MKKKWTEFFLSFDPEVYSLRPQVIRLGAVSGFIIYAIFGILDFFMMPENYKFAWLIRFGVVAPALTIVYGLSYYNKLLRIGKLFMILLLIMGQVGIVSMIYISEPNEGAYYGYYAGLVLVMLWAEFIFRFSLKQIVFISITTVLFYNIVAVFFQGLLDHGLQSKEFAWFLGNNFFLISAAILSYIGALQINLFHKKVEEQNTALKREQKELQQALLKAEEGEKLKTAFLHNISHEIRTPLNGIMGFAEILNDPDIGIQERSEYSQIINMNSEKLLSIIEDIVNISEIQSQELIIYKQKVNIHKLMLDLKAQFTSFADSVKVDFRIENKVDTEFNINTDKKKLQTALAKITDNAFKFTPTNGKILVQAELQNKLLVFMIKDTGIGIADEHKEFIFEPFRQVETDSAREFEGNGLGLSIANEYIKVIGGSIKLESKKDKGSTFYIQLPLS